MSDHNPDHVIAVLQAQRDNLFNALTMAEIAKTALTARVAELEAQIAPPAAPEWTPDKPKLRELARKTAEA